MRKVLEIIEKKTKNISILQFNFLSSSLSTEEHFPYVNEENLKFEKNRKNILIKEIKSNIELMETNIICLQELSNYWTFFKKELHKIGFDSVYLKRPNCHVSNWSGLQKSDGLGIFFKEDIYELIQVEEVYYQDEHDRIGLITLLNEKSTNQLIICATTHLYWNSKKVQVQIEELKYLEKNIEIFYKNNKSALIFLVGDLNNSPSSEIYEYMSTSFLSSQNIKMRSSYDCFKSKNSEEYGSDFEVDFTTFNFRRSWTIDYIWYMEDNKLELNSLLGNPSRESLQSDNGPEGWEEKIEINQEPKKNLNGIPNSLFGSDHLPICSSFNLIG
jgi:CCR4-NOT transcription complex subunit 6